MYTAQQIKTFINSGTQTPDYVSVSIKEVSDNQDFIKLVFTKKEDDKFCRSVKIYQKGGSLTVKISNIYNAKDMYDKIKWLVLSPHSLLTWFDSFLPFAFRDSKNSWY